MPGADKLSGPSLQMLQRRWTAGGWNILVQVDGDEEAEVRLGLSMR